MLEKGTFTGEGVENWGWGRRRLGLVYGVGLFVIENLINKMPLFLSMIFVCVKFEFLEKKTRLRRRFI